MENLILDVNGYLKIVDFGMSKILRHNQLSHDISGTPAYFAPELLQGEGHTFPADWWSVGVIMYQMLTGVLPFHNRNRARMDNDIVNKPH